MTEASKDDGTHEVTPVSECVQEAAGPPEGFELHFRRSPFTDPWEPIWSRRVDDVLYMGVVASQAHCNSRGIVHGALLTALADNAMGLSCALARRDSSHMLTTNLSIDFVAACQRGQWLEVRPSLVRASGRLCVASALLFADGEPCARANGTFRALG
ncbi:MAG: hypothetical protein RIS35_3816 [Pseudomonadota bacterium]|jgi:acyl-coenzyme A thioesterase PaaI-like protein